VRASFYGAGPSDGRGRSSGTVVAVSRTPEPWVDVVADPRERARAEANRHPEVEAMAGLRVAHRPTGFTGRLVGLRAKRSDAAIQVRPDSSRQGWNLGFPAHWLSGSQAAAKVVLESRRVWTGASVRRQPNNSNREKRLLGNA
jgi:hypothetical protein